MIALIAARQEQQEDFLILSFCADSFHYPFHSCVTAVAHKWSWLFCWTCRWQGYSWTHIHPWLNKVRVGLLDVLSRHSVGTGPVWCVTCLFMSQCQCAPCHSVCHKRDPAELHGPLCHMPYKHKVLLSCFQGYPNSSPNPNHLMHDILDFATYQTLWHCRHGAQTECYCDTQNPVHKELSTVTHQDCDTKGLVDSGPVIYPTLW